MALVTTPAIVLAGVRYSETSKIVRLATRDLGVQSAIAKGALRPKSRFGAALQLLSEGSAQLYTKEGRDLNTLGAFDVTRLRVGLAAELPRYAAASALAELMVHFAQPDPQPDVYDLFRDALDALEEAPADAVESLALRALWLLVSALGFAPALESCAIDDQPVTPDGPLPFSARDGGALCESCARTHAVAQLPEDDRRALVALLDPDAPLPAFEPLHAAAHRRLLARFIHAHLGDGVVGATRGAPGAPSSYAGIELPALGFWLERPWVPSR